MQGSLVERLLRQELLRQVARNSKSITGQYLSGKRAIPVPSERRVGNGRFIEVTGARENNLQNITARFPLGKFIAVTGVSGSGKSTLINSILKKAICSKGLTAIQISLESLRLSQGLSM